MNQHLGDTAEGSLHIDLLVEFLAFVFPVVNDKKSVTMDSKTEEVIQLKYFLPQSLFLCSQCSISVFVFYRQ